ncbi:hypothetical protein Tco_0772811 [Tanacetum coccineum]|uniref:Reverse transcriptase domain-containing protein n=1 Tax=Tanacetum coccineum TaxID=301880 RepID=A0ABQ4ZME9_9ASTR
MSSITAQQIKLDLELVPKENRFDIRKCNGRIPRRFSSLLIVQDQDFDALPTKEDTVSFLRDLGHTGDITSLNDVVVDQMHQPWITFAALINKSLSGKTSGLDKLRLFRVQIIWGAVPPKIARKFKKSSPSKKDSDLVPVDKEHVQKGKRVKRSAKKSSTTPAAGIVIRETPVKTKSTGKEKVDVLHGKGIDLLSEVALAKKAQLKELRKKSLRDFHKTHPSGSCTVAKKPPSVKKITPSVTSEGTGDKPGVPDVTEDDSIESESDDDDQEEEETQDWKSPLRLVKSPRITHRRYQNTQTTILLPIHVSVITTIPQSLKTFTPPPLVLTPTPPPTTEAINPPTILPDFASVFQFNDRITALEKEVAKIKKDPLHTQVTSLVDEHLDTRLGETREEFMNFLSESLTARIKEQVKDQQPQILPKEVSNFAPPMIKKLIKESRDEVTLAKVSSQLQSTYEAASTLTEFELKKILLDKMEKSESYLTAPEHRDCYDGLKKSYALNKDLFYSYDVYSLKRGWKDKDKDEDPSTGSDRGLKKRKTSKDGRTIQSQKKRFTSGSIQGTKSHKSINSLNNSHQHLKVDGGTVFEVQTREHATRSIRNLGDYENEPRNETALRRDWFKKPTPPQEPTDPNWNISKITQEGPTQNWLMTLAASTSTDKSLKDFDELMSTPIDFSGYILNGLKIENLTQEILLGPAFRLLKGTCSNYAELKYEFKECYKALSEKLDWENLEGGEYPLDLSKPLSLIKHGKCQRVPVEFFINNDLKYLQGGILTMTYTTYTTKTKATKYDLPGIEDMVPNIWSLVKVAYDRYALWGISHWRQQRKSFYAYARGMQSRGDIYSTKRILAVTHVKVIRKYGHGYLEEIVVRRADNILYRFKEGDFPRLQINDIGDMLILMVQNRLKNLSGDDVTDFVIALRMFTRSLVIQKRVEDLQLGVESYQKKINVTKPDTTRPDLRKRHPYTPYKDSQGFIYVDNYKRNRLMRSDELYKFSDGTLTRILSSLEDITKNIDIEYLPKRRWITLEKKRTHFMIKDINKLLKERRMMRSLKKFVGGRLYETDLRMLQRTI